MTKGKNIEAKAKRDLNKIGLGLKKSRKKIFDYNNQGGYMIIDNKINAVVHGGRYELNLNDVLDFIKENNL